MVEKFQLKRFFSYLQKTVFDNEFNLHFQKITVEYLNWDLAGLNIPTSSALTYDPFICQNERKPISRLVD